MLTYTAFIDTLYSDPTMISLPEVCEQTALNFIDDGADWSDYFIAIQDVATDTVRTLFPEILATPWNVIRSYIGTMADDEIFDDVFDYSINADVYADMVAEVEREYEEVCWACEYQFHQYEKFVGHDLY